MGGGPAVRGWAGLALLALLGPLGPSVSTAAEAHRRTLGTVRVTGVVETATAPDAWKPLGAGALLEGTRMRTADGAAMLELASGDMLILAENSACTVGTGDPLRIRLEKGRLAIRARPDSALAIETPSGLVRGPSAVPVATGFREAIVSVNEGTTEVHVRLGNFELVGPGESVTKVSAGEVATLAADSGTPSVRPAADSELETDSDARDRNCLGMATMTKRKCAALITAGGVGVAGAAVGAAAGGGAFSGGGGGGSSTGGSSGGGGSPFRTSK